jgi:hypothetical protein
MKIFGSEPDLVRYAVAKGFPGIRKRYVNRK